MNFTAKDLLQLMQEKLQQIHDICVSDDTQLSVEHIAIQPLAKKCENLFEIIVEQTSKFLQDIETTAPLEWQVYLANQIKMPDANGAK